MFSYSYANAAIKRKAKNASRAAEQVSAGMPRYLNSPGHGRPLNEKSKQKIEPIVGASLDDVRVHSDAAANRAAKSLGAKAFTHNNNIFLGEKQSSDDLRLMAHEATHVLQQNDKREGASQSQSLLSAPKGSIQKDDDEDEEGFDYSVIPPSLSYTGGGFSASADTSRAQLGYNFGAGSFGLGYNYGSDIFASTNFGFLNSRFGYNPGSGVGSLSLGGSHEGFRYGLSGNTAGSFGLNLGYGSPLLPMPNLFAQQAMAAGNAVPGLVGAVPGFFNDPLGTYDANGDRIDAVSNFAGTASQLYGMQQQGGLPFGVGLSLSYNPETQWTGSLGVQGSF